MSCCRVEISRLTRPEELRDEWVLLQSNAECSYFQSWSWIEAWLEIVVSTLQSHVIKVTMDDELLGLGIFVERDVRRRQFFRSRSLYLNEYPFDDRDMVTQYNGILSKTGFEEKVHKAVVEYFLKNFTHVDEFHFRAIPATKQFFKTVDYTGTSFNYAVNEEWATWQVDLTKFSKGIDGYLAQLSRNRRGQIRRSMRLYANGGQLLIEEAEGVEQALAYFDSLKLLHTRYWNSKSQRGSFDDSIWERFNRRLIEAGFKQGEIQLLKISGCSGVIGYIYNLIRGDQVSVIQTGFVREEDKNLMPGYVSHALAISLNQEKGYKNYDFLHGDNLYKEILSDKKQTLVCSVLQRKKIKFRIENLMVRIVRRLRR